MQESRGNLPDGKENDLQHHTDHAIAEQEESEGKGRGRLALEAQESHRSHLARAQSRRAKDEREAGEEEPEPEATDGRALTSRNFGPEEDGDERHQRSGKDREAEEEENDGAFRVAADLVEYSETFVALDEEEVDCRRGDEQDRG